MESKWQSGVSVWSPAAKFPRPVCLSLQCVPAVTLCVLCLFGFTLCCYDFSIMKCHPSVKTELISYTRLKSVGMWDSMESDTWAEVSHYKLSFHPQQTHFATAHLDDKTQCHVCSNTNQILILDFYWPYSDCNKMYKSCKVRETGAG